MRCASGRSRSGRSSRSRRACAPPLGPRRLGVPALDPAELPVPVVRRPRSINPLSPPHRFRIAASKTIAQRPSARNFSPHPDAWTCLNCRKLRSLQGDGSPRSDAIASATMSTCVVTGGAGFLGSHLCEHLLGEGHRVICIDNLETGSLQNIEHIRDSAFEFRHVDITEYVDIPEDVDFVYHLASPASPIDYLRLPLHTLKVGSHGTHHMLGVAKFKRARFLIASTSEVYGDPQVHPQTEELLGPRQPDRPARRLRRGEALRRGDDDGLPPPAGRRHLDRSHLQYLRPADAGARRAGDPDLPAPGARGPAADRVRRGRARRAASVTSTT